jgi:hypothetical protein
MSHTDGEPTIAMRESSDSVIYPVHVYPETIEEALDPEGASEQTFGGNEGIYSDLDGEQAPADEVLS